MHFHFYCLIIDDGRCMELSTVEKGPSCAFPLAKDNLDPRQTVNKHAHANKIRTREHTNATWLVPFS